MADTKPNKFGSFPRGAKKVESWPDVAWDGSEYSRPANTMGLGEGLFVVIPPGKAPNEEQLAELKQQASANKPKIVTKSTK